MRSWDDLCLHVGSIRDAEDLRALRQLGVGAFVDLAVNELPVRVWREAVYCRFPIDEGAGNAAWIVRSAIACTEQLLRSRVRTLVFCSNGMSRSVAIATGAVALVTCRPPEECLAQSVVQGPADIAPSVWRDVLAGVQSLRIARTSSN